MRADVLKAHPFNNVTENIFAKIGANLHRRPDHPICIIKEAIYAYFDTNHPTVFTKFDDLHPVVSAYAVRHMHPYSVQTACATALISGYRRCGCLADSPHPLLEDAALRMPCTQCHDTKGLLDCS